MKKTKLSIQLVLAAQLTAASVVSTATWPTYAQAPSCSTVLFSDTQSVKDKVLLTEKKDAFEAIKTSIAENYKIRNETLAKRYPQLDFVFKDPEVFVKTMNDRFEAQKKITPDDPRVFNFPEAAPTMKEIREDLMKFRVEVETNFHKKEEGLRNLMAKSLLGRESRKVQDLAKVLKYIDSLKKDIDQMTSTNNYPYRDTVYTLYFYSRIRGFFQFKELNRYYQAAKYVDMLMHGYRRLNIDSELRLYESKGSPIVQVRSGKIANEFRIAELPFRDAFERTDKLEYVIIPSVYALGSSAFMHVLPHKIHFLGATNTPVPADGFNRPGGLFWMHDVRHEADRYMKINSYRKAQNLTSKQEQTLIQLMHQWHADFLKLKNSIKDPNLKESLDHYHFYTHHDVGVPLIPSMFLNHHKNGMSVYYAFLFHKKFAGQNPKFTNWFKITRETQDVLTKFWEERLPLEKQLLQKEPVKIKSWEEWFPLSHKKTKTTVALFNKAIETESFIRVHTDKVGIDGTPSKVMYDKDGTPIYMVFSGKSQLVNRANQVIPGQGPEVHGQGYSTPIGSIRSLTIDGRMGKVSELKNGQNVTIQYESGIVVSGQLKKTTKDELGNTTILTFTTADARINDKVLYKPEWGSFDLVLGERIESIEFL